MLELFGCVQFPNTRNGHDDNAMLAGISGTSLMQSRSDAEAMMANGVVSWGEMGELTRLTVIAGESARHEIPSRAHRSSCARSVALTVLCPS